MLISQVIYLTVFNEKANQWVTVNSQYKVDTLKDWPTIFFFFFFLILLLLEEAEAVL